MNLSQITVTIAHPYGDIEVTLEEWIIQGPGPRLFVRPVSARNSSTREPLPLEVIPIQYRNDKQSIEMIVNGQIADPWNRDIELLRESLKSG
ncbi:MAG TPA: hypothetical protein VMP08_03145 [Anaerolineae bacterium]|nr:hypothetical protein [Anaerolineae bacterium]